MSSSKSTVWSVLSKIKRTVAVSAAAILITSGLPSIAQANTSRTYFVGIDGENGIGRGTQDQPFQTIQYAIDQASSGDRIDIGPGNFSENLVINKKLLIACENEGISSGWKSQTRLAETYIYGEANLLTADIEVDGCYFRRNLSDYNADLLAKPTRLIESISVTGQLRIRNSIFDLGTLTKVGCGSGVYGTAAWRIDSSRFLNQRYASAPTCQIPYDSRAVWAENAQPIVVENSRFTAGQAIYLAGAQPTGSRIENNKFEGLSTAGPFIGVPTGVIVRGNTFEGYGGVYLSSSTGTIIENNYFSATNWFSVWGDGTHTGTVIRNNAILGQYPAGYGIYSNKTIFNNSSNSFDARRNYWGGVDPISRVLQNPGSISLDSPFQDLDFELDTAKSDFYGFWPLAIKGSAELPVTLGVPVELDLNLLASNVGNPTIVFTPSYSGTLTVTLERISTDAALNIGDSIPFSDSEDSYAFLLDVSGEFAPPGLELCVYGLSPNRIWHFDGTDWVDVTTGNSSGRICGIVQSLSPFVVAPQDLEPVILFDPNYSGAASTFEQKITTGVDTRLNALMFGRAGYVFSHWNSASNGSGTSYADGEIVNLSGSRTLYAIWLQIDFRVPTVALPTGASATAGNGQATVAWQLAQGPRDDVPTSYLIEFSNNGGTTWVQATSVTGTGLSRVVSGLTNGTSYQFRVVALFGNNRATSAGTAAVVPFDPTPVVKKTKTVVYRITFTGSSSRLQAASRARLQEIATELSGKDAQVTVTAYGLRGSAASTRLAGARGSAVASALEALGVSASLVAPGTTATLSGTRVVWIKVTYSE